MRILFAAAILGISFSSYGRVTFCPVPKVCDEAYETMESCQSKKKDCNKFISVMKEGMGKYSCRRPQDKDYVPALWLCAGHDRYIGFLSKMKDPAAQKLFKGKEFQSILDGATAEQFKIKK